jgi:polar amino acid transport system substrate-binding protein
VAGNARRLEQVLVNLVINACQALESADCAIAIETGRTDGHVFVRVIDQGRGISAEDLRKITEPFFTTKRASGGSGLGLAVSERIAQEHGGALTFESEPGVGTTATLFLPFEADPCPP